eukprot:CAMPEP_0197934564 /NCGR_PEP_ID=MMETSP1439-20131203/111999_1 /TAXON_ID=66791 /ORGANISM="Gonyaulax spinifera, Strain CCMP409" /LENGTH=192 /DNA_ID=CAMNT_0043557471 /DNA_START=8 /DNA_END=587 /DNA_ORIENTATION=+
MYGLRFRGRVSCPIDTADGQGKGKGTQEVSFPGTLSADGIDDEVAGKMGITKGSMKMLDDPNGMKDAQRKNDKSLREDELREFQAAMAQTELGPLPRPAQPAFSATVQKRKPPPAAVRIRTAEPAAAADEGEPAAKQPRKEGGKGSGAAGTASEAAASAAADAAPAPSAGGGPLGLGLAGYDSDDDEDESDE